MKDGLFRIAAVTLMIRVADCQHSGSAIIDLMREAEQQQVGIVVFPELCLTDHTCGDLFRDSTLIAGVEAALSRILCETRDMRITVVIGVSVALGAELYNTATVIHQGWILGLAIKRSIPNYPKFYEARHFSPVSATRGIPFCG